MRNRVWSSLVLACATMHLAGCVKGEKAPPMLPMQAEGGRAVTPAELVSLTESLADAYAISIADAVNTVQATNPPADVRTNAQRVKVFVGTTAYTIAASPNPQIGIIDLVINISVQRAILSGGLGGRMLGDRAGPLLEAYARVDEQAWSTIGRVFSPEQMKVLRDAIDRWVAANPHPAAMSLVRAPALARYRNVSLVTTPGSIRMLAPVAEAARTAMELRLLGERSLFVAARFPYLINWQSELVLYDALDEPETRQMLHSAVTFSASSERLANLLERLPEMEAAQQSLAELKGTLEESVPVLGKLRGVMEELDRVVGATDHMLAPFQVQGQGVGGGPPVRTFEVERYTAALRELGTSVRELNTLLGNTAALVSSPDLANRLNQANALAESGLGRVAEQGNRWIDRVFWRTLGVVVAFFVGLTLYRAASILLQRRWGAKPRA